MYAQINYPQVQGINGKYTIHQIGCFITSFCNLFERFGRGLSPLDLNNILRDRGLYIDVDDGIRDDVGWGTISQYDPNVVVSGTGTSTPPTNNSIVKFIYNSFQTGKQTTHFCLVNDRNAGTIIDSWDGQVKSWNVYGGVKGWASYEYKQPQGGSNVTLTSDDAQTLYHRLFNRDGDAGGLKNYTGKTLDFALGDMLGSQEFKNLHEKTVTVEKVVEKPVEVVKEVPTGSSATPDQVLGGQLVDALRKVLK